MTGELDALGSMVRGFATFSTTDPYEQFSARLRKPHWEMAANVLGKARAVLATDPAKASRYVDAALRLPFDEDEQQAPAAVQAHMLLFDLVTDAIDESDQDDSAWLDAAIEAMEASDPAVGIEMASVLEAVGTDYKLPAAELEKLRRAVAGVEATPKLDDENFPADLMKERIMTVLALCERYDDALDAHYG